MHSPKIGDKDEDTVGQELVGLRKKSGDAMREVETKVQEPRREDSGGRGESGHTSQSHDAYELERHGGVCDCWKARTAER